MQVVYKYYAILYKGLEHLKILVSTWWEGVQGSGANPPWILDEQLLSAFLFPSEISTSKIVRLGTSLREVGNGNPLQYSCLENSMDRGAWRATIHVVAESDTTEHLCTTHVWKNSHISRIHLGQSQTKHTYVLTEKKKKSRDFPRCPVVKNLLANSGDTGSFPGPGRCHTPRSH